MARSRPLELLTRGGFVGYGIVHLLFAWLALQIAFGRPADEGDQSGALRMLAHQPLGRFLVGAVAVGLAAMAVWQAFEAAVRPCSRSWRWGSGHSRRSAAYRPDIARSRED